MKRILLCTFMLCCCISSMFAQTGSYSWTDENEVTWDFLTNENEATITSAYNYKAEVTVPEKITIEFTDAYGSHTYEYTVTRIGDGYSVFSEGGENLIKVILPSTIRVIGSCAFENCSALTSVDLSGCSSIGEYAFQWCSALTGVGDLSDCTFIGEYAFCSCSALTNVGDLSDCNSIGEFAFTDCSSLTSVDLSGCSSIGKYAFGGCSSLTSVGDLSSCTSIGEYAFNDCSVLTSVDLSGCTSIGNNVFNGCVALTSIDLSNCTSIGNAAFQNCSSLTNVGDLSNCESIGNQAFDVCKNLTSIGSLSNCKTMGEYAFAVCEKLEEIGDLSNCTSMGIGVFALCSSLKSVDVSHLTSIKERMFDGCSALTSVGNLTKCTSIGDQAFQNCSALTSVGDLSACTSVGSSAFSYCSSLTNIDLSSCEIIRNVTFYGCSSLESIDLSSCVEIEDGDMMQGAFSGCRSLTSINLPKCTTIGSNVFADCTSLHTVSLPNCISIGDCAFLDCFELANVTFPNCTNFGYGIFNTMMNEEGLANIKEITLNSTTPPTLANVGTFAKYTMIHVPASALSTYQNAPIWSEPELKNRLITIDDVIDYDVETSAQSTEPGLGRKIAKDDMRKVVTLKVSGTINSYDIIAMNNKMINLRWLDLSDATIVGCNHEYYTGYTTSDNIVGNRMFYDHDKYISIKLPKNAERIDAEAFAECNNLKEVELYEGIKSIGSGAFYRCNGIKQMNIPSGCENIGDQAFYECRDLQEVVIGEGCKGIGYSAFDCCYNLQTIKIGEGCETISSYAFSSCHGLKTLALPTTLKQIGNYAFLYCSSLEKVSLPTHLNSIGAYAFQNCYNMVELKIPSSVMYFGNYAFSGCDKLKKVYTYTLEPTTIIEETFAKSIYSTATLYVPKTSYNNYEYNTEWSQFVNHEDFDEPYEYFYINKDYVLDDQTGVVGGKPDGDLNPGSGFIQEGTEDQEMGDIHIKDDGNTSSSLIGNGNINADNLFFDMTIEGGRWYFFCFPFKVYLSDITCPGQHVWRKYDGAKRAEKGEGGWVDLEADEDCLKKGYGYIFQASQSGTLTLKVTKEQFGKFEKADHHQAVEEHSAEDENNASWNFMGNPHTSYYGIGEMGYDAPITIWTGTTYEALRPGDDDYYLKPFQAFFVQKPVGTDKLVFAADSKTTYLQSEQAKNEAKARRLARGINPDRLLVNLTLSDGTHTDKTRVVFNDKQSMGYEMACDAAKFMSTEGTPQLYTLDNKHIRYAINERPNGDVTMGYSVSKEGTYTISVARMDRPMVLRDLEMGITFDLSNGDYTFTSKAGTNEKRFVLSANQSETGIADIMKETGVNIMAVEGGIHIGGLNGQTVYIYDLSGAAVATQTTDGTTAVKAGTYVVKVDSLSTKLLVK